MAAPQRPLRILQFNLEMNVEKVNFSKFFPTSQQFVVIKGTAKSPTDFNMSVDIGDGVEKASFYVDQFGYKDNLNMMKAMRDAMQQALEFYEKAMVLPELKSDKATFLPFGGLMSNKKEEPKKKAAAKKKAAPKK